MSSSKQWCNASHSCSPEQSLLSLTHRDKDIQLLSPSLTFVLVLQVHHQQGQVVVVGWQQGFDPALLTGLVLGSKLVRPQPRLAPDQREGELLLGLAQLDGAALQDNHSYGVAVGRPVLVEEEVPLQHKPALLIGSLYLTLCDNRVLLTHLQMVHLLNFCFGEINSSVGGVSWNHWCKHNLNSEVELPKYYIIQCTFICVILCNCSAGIS